MQYKYLKYCGIVGVIALVLQLPTGKSGISKGRGYSSGYSTGGWSSGGGHK